MRIELLLGMDNVVRFPVERRVRPTLALVRDIAPDVREVLAMAEAFGLVPPPVDLRERTDAETAAHIALQFAGLARAPTAALDALLDAMVTAAVTAARRAHDQSLEAAEAQEVLLSAQTEGGYWTDPLRDRVEKLTLLAAEMLMEAHIRAEVAEGVARTVAIARRGDTWTPRDHQAEAEALFGFKRMG